MSFPTTPLPIKGELLIDGTWVDAAALGRVRLADAVRIKRGYQNEQGNTNTPDTCNFTLNNRDGLFSNRNPLSTYFGKLGRNTQFRAAVTGVTEFLVFPEYSTSDASGQVSTTDKAVLDITGDVDVRIDVDPDDWFTGTGQMLAAKYDNSTANRSWIFLVMPDGRIRFSWSADGNNPITNGTYATSSVPVPATGRLALRVTLDVNNGAAGNTATFYTSDTIAGSWTQLGSAQTLAGTTSIFNSTAPVEVGANHAGNVGGVAGTAFNDIRPLMGRVYAFELYQNIAGTLRARMDATSRSDGDTSWSDGLGTPNTWTVLAPAEITKDDRRFWGEVSEFPQKWDNTGVDVYSPITASSITRRVDAGKSPLSSALLRFYTHLTSTTGVWPMEDGFDATAASSALPGGKPAKITDLTFGPENEFPTAAGVARFNSSVSKISGTANPSTAATYATYIIHFRYPAVPSGTTTLSYINGTGTIKKWELQVSSTLFAVLGYDSAGALVGTVATTFGTGNDPDQWIMMRLQIHNSGANMIAELSWYRQKATTVAGFTSTTEFPGTVPGVFTGFQVPAAAANVDLEVGLVWIGQEAVNVQTLVLPTNGFDGESAGQRFLRLCDENTVPAFVIGPIVTTLPGATLMGPQTVNNLKSLLQECADADQGFIISGRSAFALGLRTRYSLYFQETLELDYSAGHLSGELAPTDDDQTLRNDVTVTRQGGGSGRSEITIGPNNVSNPQDDPLGVGRYDSAYTLVVQTDAQANGAAGFATYLGTWDELRYPVVKVQLERAAFVASAVLTAGVPRLDTGRALSIVNLPAWLPPDDVELMVRGVAETLGNREWSFAFNTQPYGPFRSVNNLTQHSTTRYRAAANESKTGTSASSTNASITSGATSFVVKTVAGSQTWIQSAVKPALFPLLIKVAGEVMSVAAIGTVSGTSPQLQTFSSVTRGVNGITKAHSADEPVQIAEPFYAAF